MRDRLPTIDLGRGTELGPHLHNVVWAKAYLLTKWHLDPSSCFGTIDIRRKLDGAVGRGLPSYQMVH